MTNLISNCKTINEVNEVLEGMGKPNYNNAFSYSFRIKKKHYFNVKFGDLESIQEPYFSTSTDVLNYKRTDYESCGQGQKRILQNNRVAMKFFDKWDKFHTKSLSFELLNELLIDIEELKAKYPYVIGDSFNKKVKFDRELSK